MFLTSYNRGGCRSGHVCQRFHLTDTNWVFKDSEPALNYVDVRFSQNYFDNHSLSMSSIADDRVIPFGQIFSRITKKGEPLNAILVSSPALETDSCHSR